MTPEMHKPRHIEISSVGFIARQVLDDTEWQRVGAVFERSFYLKGGESWICVASTADAAGPLSLTCNLSQDIDWYRSGIHAGMPCHVSGTWLHVGNRFFFLLARTGTWRPPLTPALSRDALARGLEGLEQRARDRIPDEGLGPFLLADGRETPTSAVRDRAAEPIARLRQWLWARLSEDQLTERSARPPIDGLIGLGPGLTPSGDDFLCGVMIALLMLGRPDQADRLFDSVHDEVTLHGNAISAAHLSAAAQGAGNCGLHAALNSVLAGRMDTTTGAHRSH